MKGLMVREIDQFFVIFTANGTQAGGLRREAKSDLELSREYSYN